jgi:hypothetical protein
MIDRTPGSRPSPERDQDPRGLRAAGFILIVVAGALLFVLSWRHGRKTTEPAPRAPGMAPESGGPPPGITGLVISSQTGANFAIDLTLHNFSPKAAAVLLPPEFSIEDLPAEIISGHSAAFALPPRQESTYRWNAQVARAALPFFKNVMADVMAGRKNITIQTRYQDELGRWRTERVSGRFRTGRFTPLGASPPEPTRSPPPGDPVR